jgi:hypothetical protein
MYPTQKFSVPQDETFNKWAALQFPSNWAAFDILISCSLLIAFARNFLFPNSAVS